MRRTSGLLALLEIISSGASPLAEPRESYYGPGLQPVERLRNITSAELEARVRQGRPFIVEDAGRDNSFLGQDCDWFHRSFPSAQMRAEYTGTSSKFVKLGSKSWYSKDRSTRAEPSHQTKGDRTLTAPYVWHVKDGGHEAPPQVRKQVQKMWEVPYFVRGEVNRREAMESLEFWFARRNGAVLAHADTYCIPAVSLQLRGTKRWHLMPPPPLTSVLDRYDAHDAGIYSTGLWQPTFEATVHEGEAIVFFPNMFHETFIMEDNPECTVAATFQFQTPVPVEYIRAFLPTHAMSHLIYEGHCVDLWDSFATLRAPRAVAPSDDQDEIQRQVARLLDLDADGSGNLSLAELEAHLTAQPWASWFLNDDYFYDYRPSGPEREFMAAELLRARALDSLAYLDLDKDGAVTQRELLSSTLQWNLVSRKLLDSERAAKKGRKAVREVDRRYSQLREEL